MQRATVSCTIPITRARGVQTCAILLHNNAGDCPIKFTKKTGLTNILKRFIESSEFLHAIFADIRIPLADFQVIVLT